MGYKCAVTLLALYGLLGLATAFTKPDQLELLQQFRDAMLARPGQQNWSKALASWKCPTGPGGACDPCGTDSWGNWEHLGCRGPRMTYTKDVVPGDGSVTNIHITDYSIEGPIPEELCHFDKLTEFDVDGGRLNGSIPTWFATCFPRLREIDLSYNWLTGTIPEELANVKTLEQLKMEHNQLTGTVPADLGSLDRLNWLRVADNQLQGTIPQALSKTAPHLSQLQIGGNDLSGNLYMLAEHHLVNFDGEDNRQLCGMVPVGARFAHGFNPYNTRLGLPCPEEVEKGWEDLSG